MKTFLILSLLFLSFLPLTDCTHRQNLIFLKPGATRADFQKDLADCKIWAMQMGKLSAMQSSGPTLTMPGAFGAGFASGMIEAIETQNYTKKCLEAKGWRQQGEIPEAVRRQEHERNEAEGRALLHKLFPED